MSGGDAGDVAAPLLSVSVAVSGSRSRSRRRITAHSHIVIISHSDQITGNQFARKGVRSGSGVKVLCAAGGSSVGSRVEGGGGDGESVAPAPPSATDGSSVGQITAASPGPRGAHQRRLGAAAAKIRLRLEWSFLLPRSVVLLLPRHRRRARGGAFRAAASDSASAAADLVSEEGLVVAQQTVVILVDKQRVALVDLVAEEGSVVVVDAVLGKVAGEGGTAARVAAAASRRRDRRLFRRRRSLATASDAGTAANGLVIVSKVVLFG